jgi:hypothetical protein
MKPATYTLGSAVLVAAVAACGGSSSTTPAPFDPDGDYQPDVDAADLSAEITNPLMPFPVGATWSYAAETDEGTETIEVVVEADPRDVWGTSARVVRDTVFLAGEMVEDIFDWYGQDSRGHVWYLGEDTTEYENGVPICNCGAWESGVDGALPGIVMLAAPAVGDVYRQEFYENEAEDYAEVVELDLSVTVPAGTFDGCIKTRDRSAIEPDLDEYKYYCPGIGNVLVEEGDVLVELIEYSGL